MFDLGSGVSFSITPENPYGGRNVSLALSGLTPWQQVRVSFNDPQGEAAAWVTAEDVHIVEADGTKTSIFVMYPTDSGELDWERHVIQDEPGTWSVSINLDGVASSTDYTLGELKLRGQENVSVGALLKRHSGLNSTVYYSELLPQTLVIDLQKRLSDTALLMERRVGTDMGELPDLYLMANREVMERVGAATGVDLGFEDGYYKSFGERPGIYMRTDLMTTEAFRLLDHEYVHRVIDELANNRNLPAWLTEGLSKFYEFDLALSGPRASASKLRLYRATDLARTSAQAGNLLSLSSLENQGDWNNQTDQTRISLQYAQAYMAVRFLNDTYGHLSAKDMVVEIGEGSDWPAAIMAVTGLDLSVFETQFNRWLQDWEDPIRESIIDYLANLEALLADLNAIVEERTKNNDDTNKRANESANTLIIIVASAKELVENLRALAPPEGAEALHQEADDYFSSVLDWLTLEFEYADSLFDLKRVQANAMIPEINAREFLFQRSMSNLQFILHLRE